MSERKYNRLSGSNVSQKDTYFITIYTSNHENVFGRVFNGDMILNEFGKVVEMQWQWLFEQYKYLEIDEYVIMPNRFHGILHFAGNNHDNPPEQHIKSLPQLISTFKTISSKLIHQLGNTNFRWQKSYLGENIHNDEMLNNIRNYIINNPASMEDE